MQQKTKLETVDIEAIKKLAEKYHINLEGQPPYSNHTFNMISKYGVTPIDLHLKKFEIFFKRGFNFNQQITHNWFKENLEVAQLIVFLNEAIQNKTDVTFSSTIKGVKKSVSLSSFSALIIEFWSLANVYLNNIQDGTYQNEFKIPSFEKEDYSYGNFKTMPDFFKDDILKKIIEYEEKNYNDAVINEKKRLAINIKDLVRFYIRDNIFDKTKKTIATNEACFLFDTLAYFGIIPETRTENNNEKYQFIKKELRK